MQMNTSNEMAVSQPSKATVIAGMQGLNDNDRYIIYKAAIDAMHRVVHCTVVGNRLSAHDEHDTARRIGNALYSAVFGR